MNKKIIILLDGTWNDPEDNTNIRKLDNLILKNSQQLVKYFPGIGTHKDNEILNDIEGSTGLSISSKIKSAYEFIVDSYEINDEIFIFGFSRGAFEARCLTSFINYLGVVDKDSMIDITFLNSIQKNFCIDRAYEFYQNKYYDNKNYNLDQFQDKFCIKNSKQVKFIGVFDTVGALGIPVEADIIQKMDKEIYKFYDTSLNDKVDYAYQALAIDEHRFSFEPTLWSSCSEKTKMEQIWFCGCHSDIGGGYEDNDKISKIPLSWMINKAKDAGLIFTQELSYDENDFKEEIHDSYKVFKEQYGDVVGDKTYREMLNPKYPNQYIHSSVKLRTKDVGLDYHPDNITYIKEDPFKLSNIDLNEFEKVIDN